MAVLAAAVLTGCSKEGNGGSDEPKYSAIVDFESAQLLTNTGEYTKYGNILWGIGQTTENEKGYNVYDGIIYEEDGAGIGSYYNDFATEDYAYDGWGGFVVSSNVDKQDLADYSNQFAAYVDKASKFAIAFDMGGWNDGTYERPTIVFDKKETVLSAMFANANKTYTHCVNNPNGVEGGVDVTLIATGYNGAAKTDDVKMQLAKKGTPIAVWTEFDLSGLGEVTKITFSFETNDNGDFGNNVPAYFCIDDIKIK